MRLYGSSLKTIRENQNLKRRLRYEWRALCDTTVVGTAVARRAAQRVAAHDAGCCQCKSRRLFLVSAWAGWLPHLLRLPLPLRQEKPGEAESRRAVKPPFHFCLEGIRISRLLQGCRFWKAPYVSAGSILCSVLWLLLNPGVSVEWAVSSFCQKVLKPVLAALPRRVLCSLLHLGMWVSVSCVGCSFFYMLFSAGSQNRSKRKNKKSWETQVLMLWSLWVQTGFH